MLLVSAFRYAALLALLSTFAYPAAAQGPQGLQRISYGLAFVENQGQWPDDVLFRTHLGGGTVWVTADALVFDFYAIEREGLGEAPALRQEEPGPARRRGHVVRMHFEGGRASRAVGHGRRQTYHNYFLGDDPARWASRVPLYDEVVLEGLYDGVDLRLYEDEGRLRYDLVVAAGADAAQIRMRMEGADGVAVTEAGALRVETALGPVEHRGLLAYQQGTRGREAVASAFRVETGGAVGFNARGVDPARRLVLDPLIWATFLGGASGDIATDAAVGADGAVTVTGITVSADFPATTGAYDTSPNGNYDAWVARLSGDGNALLYSTFLGGLSDDVSGAIAVGVDGSVTIGGYTKSFGFPTTSDAFDPYFNGGTYDAFVARFSPEGDALLYSTFLGGTRREQIYRIAVGVDGAATVVGWTDGSDFPTTPGAFDTSFGGSGDGFVARFSSDGASLLYSTFLGASSFDRATGVAVGPDGAAVVVGTTLSTHFPTTPGAYDTSHNGGLDAFVARLSPYGDALLYSTFLGGGNLEGGPRVALDAGGSAIVGGYTRSLDFPTTPGAFDPSYNGSDDAFVARLSPDGTALLYSTYLGGNADDDIGGITVGPDNSAVVVGTTKSSDFPTTPGAFDATYNGSDDAFVARLSPDGTALLYATFLGGASNDYGAAVDLSADGTAIVAGHTYDEGFPMTPGSFDTSYNGYGDAFVAHLDLGSVVSTEPEAEIPVVVAVVPNPASDRANLALALAQPSPVRLALYDVLGREVAAVDAGPLAAGAHQLPLDLSALPSGTYVWRLVVGGGAQTGRLAVVR